ncbi:MAG: hypothetical protein HN742_22055 [Lentisphaerae bacterium]|jgi:hypothetical protein|nr:hypothetical protein [Lentisphaerota bacterium]MBT5609908.1 hypothetical protein [Lentisphaerota bacterium]MBT7058251.1 hypothetical protein [Lentisphaerota bacterium]MBT7844577.1 hypothetical protein [Lentisphaerota bacterium]
MTEADSDTFALSLKPDLAAAERRWLAFWEHDLIDRPLCAIRAPRDGVTGVSGPSYMAGRQGNYREVAEQALAAAETVYWGGEAIPCYSPSFGPDLYAGWLGCDLEFAEEAIHTSWAVPCVEDWADALPIRLDPENPWWLRMLDLCAVLADTFEGKMLVSHLDQHSNMDALLAMRGGSGLCLDLMDVPELIDQAMADVRATYAPVDQALRDAGGMVRACGRIPVYHPERTNTIQCDFAALIGPEHFRRWALPALAEEAAYLGRCIMHYDGPEMLVHLDDVCTIPELTCIQWQPGARNGPFSRWMELLKRIQAKGVAVYVPCSVNDIKMYHAELDPALVYYQCSAPSQRAADDTLRWLVANT